MKPTQSGVCRIISATGYSLAGLKSAWQNETAFRQEISALVFFIPLGLWLGHTAVERSLLILTCLSVIITELINSAIEAVVDRIGPEHHDLSKRAKDLGSAAVLASIFLLIVVWGIIIYDSFYS